MTADRAPGVANNPAEVRAEPPIECALFPVAATDQAFIADRAVADS